MKHYLKNLLTAICGKNPYRQELDKVREDMEKAGEHVRVLRESYYKDMERAALLEKQFEKTESILDEYKERLGKLWNQMVSCQDLVENYRDRLAEKDAMIEEIRKDYQRQVANYEKRVGEYCVTISELQKNMSMLQKSKAHKNPKTKKEAKP